MTVLDSLMLTLSCTSCRRYDPRVITLKTLALSLYNKTKIPPGLWVGLCAPLPSSHPGILSDLSLCRSNTCCHNSYEFICTSATLCLETIISTACESYNLCALASMKILSPEERGVMWMSPLRLGTPHSLYVGH